MFRAGLLLTSGGIILYIQQLLYVCVMLTGCWQDRCCQKPVSINAWHIPVAVYTE